MSSSRSIEQQAMAEVTMFLQSLTPRVSLTEASEFLQAVWGDYTILKNGLPYGIELKAEAENRHGNFFLETWSNRAWFTLGWMYKLRGNSLFYYFVQEKELYTISIPALQAWAFGSNDKPGRIYGYPEKRQSKYFQKNDSWGRCVPIAVLQKALEGDIKLFRLGTERGRQ